MYTIQLIFPVCILVSAVCEAGEEDDDLGLIVLQYKVRVLHK